MPVISRFYGMIIKMFFLASEHNPPYPRRLWRILGDNWYSWFINDSRRFAAESIKNRARMDYS